MLCKLSLVSNLTCCHKNIKTLTVIGVIVIAVIDRCVVLHIYAV